QCAPLRRRQANGSDQREPSPRRDCQQRLAASALHRRACGSPRLRDRKVASRGSCTQPRLASSRRKSIWRRMFYNRSTAQAQEGSHDFISRLVWLNRSIWRAYSNMCHFSRTPENVAYIRARERSEVFRDRTNRGWVVFRRSVEQL